MPYTSPDQVPAWVPDAKKKQFMEVWNSVFEKAKADGKSDKDAEQLAFAEATSVIRKETNSMSTKREVRFLQDCEMRASEDGSKISGYAAVWDSPSEPMGAMFGSGFIEKVQRGAFSRALSQKQDVRALFNHDPSKVLGRTANGTLRLQEDDRGLHYEIDLPDTQVGKDLKQLVKRGDVNQSSFSFRVYRDKSRRGDVWVEPESGPAERTLTDVDLFDVSPVTYPAYPATSVSARSLWPDGIPEEIENRAAVMKKEADGEHPASHYLAVEDPSEPSTWHLRVKDAAGKPDHNLMGAAWAALHGGYRGNKYEGPKKQEAIDKLKALYKAEGMDLPGEGNSLEAENKELRAENEWLRSKLQQALKTDCGF
jgi:HK97 family phage prohead protease